MLVSSFAQFTRFCLLISSTIYSYFKFILRKNKKKSFIFYFFYNKACLTSCVEFFFHSFRFVQNFHILLQHMSCVVWKSTLCKWTWICTWKIIWFILEHSFTKFNEIKDKVFCPFCSIRLTIQLANSHIPSIEFVFKT